MVNHPFQMQLHLKMNILPCDLCHLLMPKWVFNYFCFWKKLIIIFQPKKSALKQPDPAADPVESDESVFDYRAFRSSDDDDDNGNDGTAEESSGDFVLKNGDTAVADFGRVFALSEDELEVS